MGHPELLIVPVLMLADYGLTVLGAVWKERGHDAHFESEHYELNPLFQRTIAAKRWFSPRHLALTGLAALWVWALDWFARRGELPDAVVQGVLAALLVSYGGVIGRHLGNLLLFRRLARVPGEIEGRVRFSHDLLLGISLYQFLTLLVPLALLALLYPSPHVLGALAGALLLVVAHVNWILRHRRRLRAAARTSPLPGTPAGEPVRMPGGGPGDPPR